MVVKDKASGLFSEDLIAPMVEMIRKRWKPKPAPEWITCVPSSSKPDIVTDFAKRLADRLGLPFQVALVKARENQPQSSQFNRFHQCSKLDGAFSVTAGIPNGPVLLFDDMVDSAWTMTVSAALLLNSGSGPVWPVALSTMNPGL
jgi:ATP-dependent DNA helicase RecQ